MKRIGMVTLGVIACAALLSTARGATPEIHTEDVDRFYKVYDAAGGHPTAEQLQRDYIDPGSEGLHQLAKVRNVTGARIADTLTKRPEVYSGARACMAVLPRVRERVGVALQTLVRLYPQAKTPPVTIAVGRGKPVGVGSPVTGLQIGLEALCATAWMNPDVEDRFVHVIAHEYAHVQQVAAIVDDEHPTVLQRSLIEGGAEFVAELISGKTGYSHFATLTKGREQEIETAFAADVDKTDLSRWLDNSTAEKPDELGCWVGYRIVKTYYQRAADKQQALREILELTDPKAFLARSGWRAGASLLAPSPVTAALPAGPGGLIERFVEAWNSHDPKAFEALFTADATWVATFDSRLEGRDAIVADLRTAHESWAKASTVVASKPLVKSLRPDVATVQFNLAMTMRKDAEPLGRTLLLVAGKQADGWKIAAGQLTKPNCPP